VVKQVRGKSVDKLFRTRTIMELGGKENLRGEDMARGRKRGGQCGEKQEWKSRTSSGNSLEPIRLIGAGPRAAEKGEERECQM